LTRTAKPDTPLDELLRKISATLAEPIEAIANRPERNLDSLIADAVLRCDLLSWGRKDGAAQRELIPQLVWELGRFDHHTGKLVYRHPDSPYLEEYTDIAFNNDELEPWLRELGSRRQG